MSEPSPTRRRLLPPQLVKPLAIAFGIGLLLFFLVWLDQRNDTDFFKAGDPATGARGIREFEGARARARDGDHSGRQLGVDLHRTDRADG